MQPGGGCVPGQGLRSRSGAVFLAVEYIARKVVTNLESPVFLFAGAMIPGYLCVFGVTGEGSGASLVS